MSLERLVAVAAAHKRLRAGETLKLAQAIVAGQSGNTAWQKVQKQLMEDSK